MSLILGCTYALVIIIDLAPHEWAAEVGFVVAHLAAAEVLLAQHTRGHPGG